MVMSGFGRMAFLLDVVTGWAVGVSATVLSLALLAILFYVLSYRKRMRRQFERLRERYRKSVSLLETDCQTSLSRLEYLAKHSPRYHDRYAECAAEDQRLAADQKAKAREVIESSQTMLSSHNYGALKHNLQEGGAVLLSLEDSVESFRKTLADTLAQDSAYHGKIYLPKEKLRSFKLFIARHEVEIRPVQPVLDTFFRGLDECFSQYDVDLDKGLYQEADRELAGIVKVVAALDKYGRDLPQIVPLAENVIPAKLKNLYREAKETEREVPIYHLKIDEELERMAAVDEKIQASFETMALEGAKESLAAVSQRIADLEAAFEKEKEAKRVFAQRWGQTGNGIYRLQAQHSCLVGLLPKYQAQFVIEAKYLDPVVGLADHVDSMVRMKSDLDSATNASYPQPYTLLLGKLEALNRETAYVELTMRNFAECLERLKRQVGELGEGIGRLHTRLWEADARIRDFDVKAFTEKNKPELARLFAALGRIDKVLVTVPVDAPQAAALLGQAESAAGDFCAAVEKDLALAHKGEEAIVYANQYRREFSRADQVLGAAEQSFAQCEFRKCYELASGVIKELRPDQAAKEQHPDGQFA